MKRRYKILRNVILALAGYLLLLWLLVLAEKSCNNKATIDTISEAAIGTVNETAIDTLPKALWYSLVTLTTVGYGDVYPVTLGGRIIGALFLLLSTGLLAVLIGLAVASFTDRLLPDFRLWRERRKRWYIFSTDNAASRALAARLEDGLIVFCRGKATRSARKGLTLRQTPEALFDHAFAQAGERTFFAMDKKLSANEGDALALLERPVRIYCRCEGLGEGLPENITPFNEYECCARLYWQSRPWNVGGERIALLGNGRYARALLIQGLLTAPPGCAVDLFGDWTGWREMHQILLNTQDIGPELRFHDQSWRANVDLLREADRVVLCFDDHRNNLEALYQLRQFCPTRGRIDVRSAKGLQDAYYFGQEETLFTPELIMKQALNRLGRQMHELYRAQSGNTAPAFEALSDFLKRSNFAAADHLLTKARLLLPEADVRTLTPEVCREAAERFDALSDAERDQCRRIEHNRWVLFHALHNWRYAPQRDNDAREHPMMVPYDELSEPERRKDDNAWLLLHTLAKEKAL